MTHLPKIVLAILACAATSASAHAAEAKELWTAHCAKCHGPDGVGETPMGKKLKLRDLSDPAVQDAVADEAILKSITEGVTNDAGKKVMPAFAEKIPPGEIPALVGYVRLFRKEG